MTRPERGTNWKRTETSEQIAAAKEQEDTFLTYTLPAVKRMVLKTFFELPHDRRQDLLAAGAAHAWRFFVQFLADGVDPIGELPLLVWKVRARLLKNDQFGGQESVKDALSHRAQVQKKFRVVHTEDASAFVAQQVDPATQAAHNLDLAALKKTLSTRAKSVLEDLCAGFSGQELIESYGVSKRVIARARKEIVKRLQEQHRAPAARKYPSRGRKKVAQET